MDAIDWDLSLTVFDRYGLNPRPLKLTEYAMRMLSVIRKEHEERSAEIRNALQND